MGAVSVLIPNRPQEEVASELNALRAGCPYAPSLFHGQGRKEGRNWTSKAGAITFVVVVVVVVVVIVVVKGKPWTYDSLTTTCI